MDILDKLSPARTTCLFAVAERAGAVGVVTTTGIDWAGAEVAREGAVEPDRAGVGGVGRVRTVGMVSTLKVRPSEPPLPLEHFQPEHQRERRPADFGQLSNRPTPV